MRALVDFHHSSLLRSLQLLLEDRLGIEVYRPIGMEWYEEKFWDVYPHIDTARQYLGLDQSFQPGDGTPPLNNLAGQAQPGVYFALNPDQATVNRGATLDFVKNNQFDYLIASLPQHIPLFERLQREYQPQAKLIVQLGNNWDVAQMHGYNIMASIYPRDVPDDVNVVWYHQEFETDTFHPSPVLPSLKIHCYINFLKQHSGYQLFRQLEGKLYGKDYIFRSYGGGCRDGAQTGHIEMANSIRESMFVYHVKATEGFGHVIYNAYACGRPVIISKSALENVRCGELLVPGTYVDVDGLSADAVAEKINEIVQTPGALELMGQTAANRFAEVVNYKHDAEKVQSWLQSLR